MKRNWVNTGLGLSGNSKLLVPCRRPGLTPPKNRNSVTKILPPSPLLRQPDEENITSESTRKTISKANKSIKSSNESENLMDEKPFYGFSSPNSPEFFITPQSEISLSPLENLSPISQNTQTSNTPPPLKEYNNEHSVNGNLKIPRNEDSENESLINEKVKPPVKKKSRLNSQEKKEKSKKLVSLPKKSQSLPEKLSPSDSDDDFELKIIIDKKSNKKNLISENKNDEEMQKEILEIKNRIKSKSELLEKLKSKTENEENKELKKLIKIWRNACQKALEDLLSINKKRRADMNVNMEELLNILHIPCDLIKYDNEKMCFI